MASRRGQAMSLRHGCETFGTRIQSNVLRDVGDATGFGSGAWSDRRASGAIWSLDRCPAVRESESGLLPSCLTMAPAMIGRGVRRPENQRSVFGREREVADLGGCLGRVGTDGAQVVAIEGEVGIGKSTLVAGFELAARREGFQVLRAGGDELGGRRAFGLVTDCFALSQTTAPYPLAPAMSLAERDSVGRAAGDEALSVAESTIAVIEDLCERAPVAIVLEDLHWADSSSLVVLARMLRHIAPLPVAMVMTARPLPRPAELTSLLGAIDIRSHLLVKPLDEVAVARLVASVLGAQSGPNLAAQVAMAGGNPLFILELIDALAAEDELERNVTASTGVLIVDVRQAEPPPSFLLTVLHRLSHLSKDTQRILSLSAVLGTRVRPSHLASLAKCSVFDLVEPLGEARASGLLREDGDDLVFRHELVREALYSDLPLGIRSGLHREVARVLERAGAPVGLVAEHMIRGAERGDDEAIGWLVSAARAMASDAPSVAVDLLEHAISLAHPTNPLLLEARADLAVALLWSGHAFQGEEACRRVLLHESVSRRRVAVRQCLVESLLLRGQSEAVLAEVASGISDVESDPKSRARIEGVAAMAHLFLGNLSMARSMAFEVHDAGAACGDVALAVQALVIQALLAESEGQVTSAVDLGALGVATAEADGSRSGYRRSPHLTYAMSLINADRFEDADRVLERAREVHESLGARSALPILHVGFGFSRFWAGNWNDAEIELDTAMALAEETGTGWRAAARGLRAIIALGRGDRDRAEQWIKQGQCEVDAGETLYRAEWIQWARALWLEEIGERARAVQVLRPMADAWVAGGGGLVMSTVAPTVVRLLLTEGHRSLADSVAQRIEGLAAANPAVRGIGAAAVAARAQMVGDPEGFVKAADLYRLVGRTLEEATVHEAAADAFAASGRRDEATACLDKALAAYGALGADAFGARAARRLGSAREFSGRSSPGPLRPTHGWDSLTPAEHVVLRLVFERRSNPEIARELVVSRRTVETHVSHILAKVGLRSRVELAEQAARHFGWRLRLEQLLEEG